MRRTTDSHRAPLRWEISDRLRFMNALRVQERIALGLQLVGILVSLAVAAVGDDPLLIGAATAYSLVTIVTAWRLSRLLVLSRRSDKLDDAAVGLQAALVATLLFLLPSQTALVLLLALVSVTATTALATHPALQSTVEIMVLVLLSLALPLSRTPIVLEPLLTSVLFGATCVVWVLLAIVATRTDRLARLNELLVKVAGTQDGGTALQEIVAGAEDIQFDGAFIKIIDSTRHLLDVAGSPSVQATEGWPDNWPEAISNLSKLGLLGKAMARKKTYVLGRNDRRLCKDAILASVLGTGPAVIRPLVYNDECMGVFAVHGSHTKRRITNDDLSAVEAMATQAESHLAPVLFQPRRLYDLLHNHAVAYLRVAAGKARSLRTGDGAARPASVKNRAAEVEALIDLGINSAFAVVSGDDRGLLAVEDAREAARLAADRVGAHFAWSGTGSPPERPHLCVALYGYITELAANAHHHANAQDVSVVCSQDEASLAVSVIDDGDGHPIPETLWGCSGLLGIRCSLQDILDGQLAVLRAPGGGWHVQVTIPLTAAERVKVGTS